MAPVPVSIPSLALYIAATAAGAFEAALSREADTTEMQIKSNMW